MSEPKFHPESPASLKRVLPALRMMVRYPTKTTNVVSFETSVELAELREVIRVRGRPTTKLLQEIEEQIAEGIEPDAGRALAEKLGGKAKPAPVREIAAPKPAAQVASEAAPTAPVRPWLTQRTYAHVVEKYLALVERMLAEPVRTQADLCREADVSPSAWHMWRSQTFGQGRCPARSELEAWVEWARSFLAARSGRRPAANPAASSPPAAAVKPVTTLAELSGKERRHLVASVAVGLLAEGGAVVSVKDVVASAFDVVAEIVRQDAAHSAPNGGAS